MNIVLVMKHFALIAPSFFFLASVHILPWNISRLLFNFSGTRAISYISQNSPQCLAQFLIKLLNS